MNQMILEFSDSDLTKLEDEDILISKCENVGSTISSAAVQAALSGVSELHTVAQIRRMKIQPSPTKLRGGYYTPELIANFLAKWAIRSNADSILEPSFGDGVFVEAGVQRLKCLGTRVTQIDKQVFGFELERAELRKALKKIRAHELSGTNLYAGDFFEGRTQKLAIKKFDVVLGNPPFIRYQNFLCVVQGCALTALQMLGFPS